MDVSKNSPYAAPYSPIASSKRPRVAKKDIKSPTPIKAKTVSISISTPVKDENTPRNSSGLDATATPSKIMFSPSLRGDAPAGAGRYYENNMSTSSDHNDINTINNTIQNSNLSSSMDQDDLDNSADRSGSDIATNNFGEDDSEGQTSVEANQEDANEDQEETDAFNPYFFIAGLPAHSTVQVRGKICLPPKTDKLPTLTLDLDETLVHCTVEPIEKPDVVFPVTFNGTVYQVYVRKRPYLDYFLENVCNNYEVVVFTASQRVYADALLNLLDPNHKLIKHRLFREACLLVQGNYLKDLTVLNRDMKSTILVDNSPHAYGYQPENGIPIESWYDDESDTELLKLLGFLKKLEGQADVRPLVRKQFKTEQLIERAAKGLSVPLHAPPF